MGPLSEWLPWRSPCCGAVRRLHFARWTVAQVQPEHTVRVQLQQELKLHRHGMELLFGLYVIVVVVLQGAESVRVVAEGPEAIQVHVAAELQRQAGHDQAAAGPDRTQTFGAPEDGEFLEVLGVEKDGPGGASKVFNGVKGPQGHGSVVAIGEGGNQQQGVAIATQTLYEWTPPPHESAVPKHKQAPVNKWINKTADRLSSLLKEDAGVRRHQVGLGAHVLLVAVVQWRQVAPERIIAQNDTSKPKSWTLPRRTSTHGLTWWQTEPSRSSFHSRCRSGSLRSRQPRMCPTFYSGKDAPEREK